MRPILFVTLAAGLAAQGPLPPPPVPPQNPITPAKAILGKLLFWEEQMSSNNRVACGTCHTFAAGGGDLRRARHPGPDGTAPSPDDIFGSPGIPHGDADNDYQPDPRFGFADQITPRASPSFLTAAWFPELFWDGRARTNFVDPETGQTTIPSGGALESQAIAPILAGDEMAHDGRLWSEAITKLRGARPMALATDLPPDMAAAVANGATYASLFTAAFGTADITAQRIAYALATYQRTLVPDQTPWDRFQRGVPGAMTQQQMNGMNVFNGPGRCNLCHAGSLFSDRSFRNLGLRPIADDRGRQNVSNNPADLRRSFMHNGQFTSVNQVFGFYLGGGGPFPDNKDPLLAPLQVPPPAANDLIAFVATALTDPRVQAGQAPFDRPTLAAGRIPPAGFQYGLGTPGSGARVPTILAAVPANVGNVDFKVGVANALGGAAATLVVAPQAANTQYQGIQVLVDVFVAPALFWTALEGPVGAVGGGYGTVRFALPPDPALAGITLFAQWFVWDAAVAPGASSRGAELRLF
jgi:cytochrome c peroxidase